MTPIRTGLLALLCIVLVGCGGEQDNATGNDTQAENGSDSAARNESAAEDKEEAPPVPVETTNPERGDVRAVYAGTAPIEAIAEADVVAKVAGEVRFLNVEEGDLVSEGQVLAQLDGDRLRLELGQSEANLRKLQRDFERNKDLRDKGLLSEGDFEKIQFEMEALEAQFNLARLELDYTYIRAPIDGVVSERMVKLGNTIEEGAALFRVTSLNPLVAYLFVPEREYRRITSGQPVGIAIDALPGEQIIASVTRVSPIVDPATGTFKITIEISDEEQRVKPGMFGRIAIVYDQRANALKIQRTALIEDASGTSVFVVEDDIARRRVVETGYTDSGMVEILSGLDDDDEVVTAGQAGLKQDSKVTVINRPGEAVPADDPDAASDEIRTANAEEGD
jgi:membrane fusion protein (multidrug efflux system)